MADALLATSAKDNNHTNYSGARADKYAVGDSHLTTVVTPPPDTNLVSFAGHC